MYFTVLLGKSETIQDKFKYQNTPFSTLEETIEVDKLFFEAMKKVETANYLESLEIIEEIKELHPTHPGGYLFYAVVVQWIIQNYRDYDYKEIFFDNIEKAIDYSGNLSRLNAWRYVFLGGAYGFRGIQESELGNFFSAFHDGLRGVNRIQRALELDPTIFDSYYGLGTYTFWKAFFTDKFFFLTGGKENKDEGINYIIECVELCHYTKEVAERSLVRIYYVDKRYEETIALTKRLLKKLPYNISIIMHQGHAQLAINQKEEAIASYKKMKTLLQQHQLSHPYAFLEANYYLAKAYETTQNYEEAKKLYLETEQSIIPQVTMEVEPMEIIWENFEALYEEIKNKYNP